MPDILNIGISGLGVAMANLTTSSHNIANASTPGYSRQSVVQTTAQASYSGVGYFGNGASVSTIKRSYSMFLEAQVLRVDAEKASLEAYDSQMSQLNNSVTSAQSALSANLTEFFTAVDNMAAYPANIPARQEFLSTANTMVSKFQSMNELIGDVSNSVEGGIRDAVTEINNYARQLAVINNQITIARAQGQGNEPNDLLDNRSLVLAEMNKLVKVTTYAQSDGTITVAIGKGQTVVNGASTNPLIAMPDSLDKNRFVVGLGVNGSATGLELPEELLTGGKLGGLLEFRREALEPTRQGMGRIAVGVADMMNKVSQQGVDLFGRVGRQIFAFGEGTNTRSDLSITARADNVLKPSALTATITDPDNAGLNSQYKLTFSGGSYSLTDFNTNNPVSLSGGVSNPNPDLTSLMQGVAKDLGFSVALVAGNAFTEGDSFVLDPRPLSSQQPYSTAGAAQPAAFSPIEVLSLSNNALSAHKVTATITDVGNLEVSDYKIEMKSNVLTMTRTADNQKIGSGESISELMASVVKNLGHDVGFTLSADGTPQNGDVFLIKPTSAAVDKMRVVLNDPSSVALAAPVIAETTTRNIGNGKLTVSSYANFNWNSATAPLDTTNNPPVKLTYSSTGGASGGPGFTVEYAGQIARLDYMPSTNAALNVDLGIDTVEAPTNAPTVFRELKGLKLHFVGVPGEGDTFAVKSNLAGVADNSNALAMRDLQTARTLGGRTANFQQAYGQMVADIGVKANAAQVNLKTQTTLSEQAHTQIESLSGVNLDEEASNLVRFQQAYQASAQVMTIARKMFDEILAVAKSA